MLIEPVQRTRKRTHREVRLARVPLRPLSAVLLAAAVAAGCAGDGRAGDSAEERPLLVMAAASLAEAMPEIIRVFEQQTGVPVDMASGATSTLAAQIEHGAPADLFFAADEATIDRLVMGGSIRDASVRRYATGRLALVWREGSATPAQLADLMAPAYQVVAIANPEIAPYGAAAREALGRSGVWDALQPRIVLGENVTQTYQLVRTGNADAALVSRSVLDTANADFVDVDPALHDPIHHSAGIVATSEHSAAQPFLDYVLSPGGQAILATYGFGAVPRQR